MTPANIDYSTCPSPLRPGTPVSPFGPEGPTVPLGPAGNPSRPSLPLKISKFFSLGDVVVTSLHYTMLSSKINVIENFLIIIL